MTEKEDGDEILTKLPEIHRQILDAEAKHDYSDIATSVTYLQEINDELQRKCGLISKLGDACADLGIADIFVQMMRNWWQATNTLDEKKPIPKHVCKINTLLGYLTETSDKFRARWISSGGFQLALDKISSEIFISKMDDTNILISRLISDTLFLFYNTSRISTMIHILRQEDTAEYLAPYTKSENLKIRTVAILTTVTILDEKKSFADTQTIKFIVEGIGTEEYFHTIELLDGLAMLAVSDDNKNKIIEAGALPVFTRLLHEDSKTSAQEMVVILRIIWNLAFVQKVRQDILSSGGLVDAIEKSSKDDNKDVSAAATGALWKLKDRMEHIFISYQWDDQETVLKLKEMLKSEGHEVWVDVDKMSGSTLEAMALAVEEAAIVLICMSEKYKQSPNCRTEGEYTFARKKCLIPLMMQQHYTPDGWLGAMIGSKLYINFNGKESFEQAYGRLKKELENNYVARKELRGDPMDEGIAAPAPRRESHATDTWTTQRVQQWVQEQGLEKPEEVLKKSDGKMLLELKKMKKVSPEFFHNYMWKELKMDLLDILNLSKALDNLE